MDEFARFLDRYPVPERVLSAVGTVDYPAVINETSIRTLLHSLGIQDENLARVIANDWIEYSSKGYSPSYIDRVLSGFGRDTSISFSSVVDETEDIPSALTKSVTFAPTVGAEGLLDTISELQRLVELRTNERDYLETQHDALSSSLLSEKDKVKSLEEECRYWKGIVKQLEGDLADEVEKTMNLTAQIHEITFFHLEEKKVLIDQGCQPDIEELTPHFSVSRVHAHVQGDPHVQTDVSVQTEVEEDDGSAHIDALHVLQFEKQEAEERAHAMEQELAVVEAERRRLQSMVDDHDEALESQRRSFLDKVHHLQEQLTSREDTITTLQKEIHQLRAENEELSRKASLSDGIVGGTAPSLSGDALPTILTPSSPNVGAVAATSAPLSSTVHSPSVWEDTDDDAESALPRSRAVQSPQSPPNKHSPGPPTNQQSSPSREQQPSLVPAEPSSPHVSIDALQNTVRALTSAFQEQQSHIQQLVSILQDKQPSSPVSSAKPDKNKAEAVNDGQQEAAGRTKRVVSVPEDSDADPQTVNRSTVAENKARPPSAPNYHQVHRLSARMEELCRPKTSHGALSARAKSPQRPQHHGHRQLRPASKWNVETREEPSQIISDDVDQVYQPMTFPWEQQMLLGDYFVPQRPAPPASASSSSSRPMSHYIEQLTLQDLTHALHHYQRPHRPQEAQERSWSPLNPEYWSVYDRENMLRKIEKESMLVQTYDPTAPVRQLEKYERNGPMFFRPPGTGIKPREAKYIPQSQGSQPSSRLKDFLVQLERVYGHDLPSFVQEQVQQDPSLQQRLQVASALPPEQQQPSQRRNRPLSGEAARTNKRPRSGKNAFIVARSGHHADVAESRNQVADPVVIPIHDDDVFPPI